MPASSCIANVSFTPRFKGILLLMLALFGSVVFSACAGGNSRSLQPDGDAVPQDNDGDGTPFDAGIATADGKDSGVGANASKAPGERWWETLPTHIRFYPKHDGQTLRSIEDRLDELRDDGYRVVEIFAPFHGGPIDLWAGLAPVNYYATDPSIGSLDDFKRLVDAAHERGMALIIFHNLGYFYRQSPLFRRVEQDVGAAIDSAESRWFFWSSDGQTPVGMTEEPSHFFNQGEWVYSAVARKYFFSRWAEQPQMNWADAGWRQEAAKALRFWLDLGVDGMLVDAPNWYLNYDWAVNREFVTGVIANYPNRYANPEGGSAFDDDPVPWIERGGWTGIQDFSLQTYWDNEGVIADAIEAGNADAVESALVGFRDRVVAAGGVTKTMPLWERTEMSRSDRLLEIATIVAAGAWLSINGNQVLFNGAKTVEQWPAQDRDRVKALVRLLATTAALQPTSARRRQETDKGSKAYALVRGSGGQRVIATLNYAGEPSTISIAVPDDVADGRRWRDLLSGEEIPVEGGRLRVALPASGYAFLQMR